MTRISRRHTDKELLKESEEQLTSIIYSLTNKQEINGFLDEFLTKEEKVMLGKRLILYMLLYKGFTSSQIHDALSMSYETIRWYRHIYEMKPALFKQNIEKLIRREKAKELWSKIERALKPLSLALEAKSNMRARSKLLSGDYEER